MSGITIHSPSSVLDLAAASTAKSKRAWFCWLLYLLSGAAVLSPLLWAKVPPLVDYPNHLARMWILVHRGDIAELAQNYVLHWRILPDLAMDCVVPALSQLMPVLEAGRLFIALTMAGLVAGTIALHRVLHGRFAIWPILSVLFVFNAVLFWGFLSCLFASAVYLLAFSGRICQPSLAAAPPPSAVRCCRRGSVPAARLRLRIIRSVGRLVRTRPAIARPAAPARIARLLYGGLPALHSRVAALVCKPRERAIGLHRVW